MISSLRQQQLAVQNGTFDAQVQNPHLLALLNELVTQITGKTLGELPQDERNMWLVAGSAVNNSFISDMFGISNGGENYEHIYRGLSNNTIPMYAYDKTGNGRYMGTSRGGGNVPANLTTQFMHSFNDAVYTSGGGVNSTNIRGMSPALAAQLAGKLLSKRGMDAEEALAVDFSGTASDMESRFDDINSKLDDQTKERFQTLIEARKDYEGKMQTGLDSRKALNKMRTEGKFDTGVLDDLQLQSDNGLRGTLLSKEVGKDVMEGVRELGGNLKELSELTGFKELEDLQAVADTLKLGALDDKKDIDKVRRGLAEMKQMASNQNRDVKEVMKERQDVVQMLAPVFGGAEYVPSSTVEAIQKARHQGNLNYESGRSLISGDEELLREGRGQALAAQEHVSLSRLRYAAKQNQGNMSPEYAMKVADLEERYAEAIKNGNHDELRTIRKEMDTVSGEIGGISVFDQEYTAKAVAADTSDRNEMSRLLNLKANIGDAVTTLKNRNDIGVRIASAKGGINDQQFARLTEARNKAFGRDSKALDANADILKFIALEKDPTKKAAMMQKAREQWAYYPEDVRKNMEEMMDIVGNSNFEYAEDIDRMFRSSDQIIQQRDFSLQEGGAAKADNARQQHEQLLRDLAFGDEAYKKTGFEAVLAGLTGEADYSPAGMINLLMDQGMRTQGVNLDSVLDKYGAGTLGYFENDEFKWTNNKTLKDTLSGNATLLKAMGLGASATDADIDTFIKQHGGEEEAKKYALERMKSTGLMGRYGNSLVYMDPEKANAAMKEMKEAYETDDAKALRNMYGADFVTLDGEGKAHVVDAQGNKVYNTDNSSAKVAALMIQEGDRNKSLRKRIAAKAKSGDAGAKAAQDAMFKTIREREGTADDNVKDIASAEAYLKQQWGTANFSAFNSREAADAAGIKFGEDGKIINENEQIKGKTLDEVRDAFKRTTDDELADLIQGNSEGGVTLGTIADMIKKIINDGLYVTNLGPKT